MILGSADVSYGIKFSLAIITLYQYPEEKLIEYETTYIESSKIFKYSPGMLFLREAPLLIETYQKLKNQPHFLIVNGHGLAHPYRFGLATVLELALGVPTIGCAREPLIGKYKKIIPKRGNISELIYQGETVGLAIWTKDKTKPLIISSGGKLDFNKLKEIIFLTTTKTKLPLPLIKADRISRSILKKELFQN